MVFSYQVAFCTLGPNDAAGMNHNYNHINIIVIIIIVIFTM